MDPCAEAKLRTDGGAGTHGESIGFEAFHMKMNEFGRIKCSSFKEQARRGHHTEK